MAAIRVLVVDDSVVVRRLLVEALTADSSIEVAGTAPDGQVALTKISLVRPDLITLDVEMPVMSGLETLREIRKLYPKLPVIMFSTLTERGATTTLDALTLGASDYVTKPSNTGGVEQTRARIQADLIPKVKALCRVAREESLVSASALIPAPPIEVRRGPTKTAGAMQRIDLVAIGCSTGGPNALAALLPSLSGGFPVPIVIVQHMPPLFTRLLAERLDRQCSVRIREGKEAETLQAGGVWIAPGDFHMQVVREAQAARLTMNQEPPQNSCRPSVDVLFESVAKEYGPNVLGVVLTGMGSDGVRGSQCIRAAGGQVIVQNEATSVVWGMPGQVAAAGQADGVFPLQEMAAEIEKRANWNRFSSANKPAKTVTQPTPAVARVLPRT
jgi:two-component system, chemotaxis family, protein-glutamate methylesterase/glutaminase